MNKRKDTPPQTDHDTQMEQDVRREPHELERNASTDPREQEQRVRQQPEHEKSRGRGTHQR